MARITGSVKDIVDVSMADQVVELVFRLNGPNVRSASGAGVGTIYPTEPRRVDTTAGAGFFEIDLVRTDQMLADAWYELGIVWQGSAEPLWDFPDWQIRVTGDAIISETITLGPPNGGWNGPIGNLSLVLVSLTQPDNLQVGQLWLQSAPTEFNNPESPLNTGKLYRGAR